MIVTAYAQASDRQGVDAAVNGTVVDSDTAFFAELRRRSIALNLEATPVRIGEVECRVGSGLVRLQFDGDDLDEEAGSPIVVLVDDSAFVEDREAVVQAACDSVSAIGRGVSPIDVRSGLSEAARMLDLSRRRRRVEVALVVGLAATVTVILVAWPRTPRNARKS